jgi:hypothetical protein
MKIGHDHIPHEGGLADGGLAENGHVLSDNSSQRPNSA